MPIGFTLPLRRADGGYFEMSNDLMTQIKSNFINLVSTMKGERMSNPEFGCDIHQSVFNFNNDDLYEQAIKNSVQRSKLFSWETTARRTLEIYNNINDLGYEVKDD